MTDTITRSDYALAEHLGAAGTVADLQEATATRWREQNSDWQGKYWIYSAPDDLTARYLHPVNLAPRTKTAN